MLFYLSDHLGSTRGVVDYWGNLVETRDYDPWGQSLVAPTSGSMQLKHRFTSQPFDMVAGLYNYGARMYDPKWGRFVSPDAIAEAPTSQGLNRYSYVSNTPTSLVDPKGERRQCGDFLVFCFVISGSSRGRINVSFSSGPLISGTFANQGPWSEQGGNVWSIPIDGGILDGGGGWSETWLRYSSDTHLGRIFNWSLFVLGLDWLAKEIARATREKTTGARHRGSSRGVTSATP